MKIIIVPLDRNSTQEEIKRTLLKTKALITNMYRISAGEDIQPNDHFKILHINMAESIDKTIQTAHAMGSDIQHITVAGVGTRLMRGVTDALRDSLPNDDLLDMCAVVGVGMNKESVEVYDELFDKFESLPFTAMEKIQLTNSMIMFGHEAIAATTPDKEDTWAAVKYYFTVTTKHMLETLEEFLGVDQVWEKAINSEMSQRRVVNHMNTSGITMDDESEEVKYMN